MASSPTSRLFFVAGLSTWAIMFGGAMWQRPPPGGLPAALVGLGWLSFAAAFWGLASPLPSLRRGTGASRASVRAPRAPAEQALLAIQSTAVVGLTALGHGQTAGVLLAVVAGQTPFCLPPRAAAGWLCAQSVAFGVALWPQAGLGRAVLTSAGFAGFQLFAFGAAFLAKREAEGRAELARANAELIATRRLLAEGAREGERLRIARELHDVLGHHLTALNLQLEAAWHRTGGDEAVERARSLGRDMLAQVREVVSALRDEPRWDLGAAVRALVQDVPGPRVHLELPGELAPVDPAAAHAVLRCVQEALTNVARHARAENAWVSLRQGPEALEVCVRDDGVGATALSVGNGLNGMRERAQALGGALVIETSPGRGLTLRATFPSSGATR